MTELNNEMTLDDVHDLNIVLAAEADAERRMHAKREANKP